MLVFFSRWNEGEWSWSRATSNAGQEFNPIRKKVSVQKLWRNFAKSFHHILTKFSFFWSFLGTLKVDSWKLFEHNWIQTRGLWCQKQLLWQLCLGNCQCDKIWRILMDLADKISYKYSQNIWLTFWAKWHL